MFDLISYLKQKIFKKQNFLYSIQASLQWIEKYSIAGKGVAVTSKKSNIPYPEVSGYLIPTLLNWGESDKAINYAKWLIGIQNEDGSWSDSLKKSPYTFDTGQVLKGLLAVRYRFPDVEDSISRGCHWLLKQIHQNGRITTPDKSEWKLPDGKMIDESIHLYALEPLKIAGDYLKDKAYHEAVDRSIKYYLGNSYLVDFEMLSHFHAYVLEALIDLGLRENAERGMKKIEILQKTDGSIPSYPNKDWICSTGVAQYSVIWFKLGQREKALKALNYLSRKMKKSGGFYGSYGNAGWYFPREEISWANKYFLDACYLSIATAFDERTSQFPSEIDSRDPRLITIMDALGDVSGLRILDAGCGKGRFIKAIKEKYPKAYLWGVDISEIMLSYLPSKVEKRTASLLNLPFSNCYFDKILCVESLEHAVYPKKAVRELCRVLKKGGTILIIDKNEKCRGALQKEVWEKWFIKKDVENWLKEYCTEVTASFIKCSNHKQLFICWKGKKAF